eukprot:Colp12_sorted_trinity150504_noHs@15207
MADNADTASEASERGSSSGKVVVRFRAVGNAPILKVNKFKINSSDQFQAVISHLRKWLKLQPSDSIFLYVNQAFSPSPDETIDSLFKCFQVDGRLDIHYCTTPAWG